MDDQPLQPPDGLDLPSALRRELEALARPGIIVPPEVDRMVLEAARARFGRRRVAPRFLPWAAAAALAASLALAVLLPHLWRQPEPGIMRAFALARLLDAGQRPGNRWDFNHDGVVDRRDVEALAEQAVMIDPGQAAPNHSQTESAPSPSASGRFAAVEVDLDPRGRPLAAYQIRFTAKQGKIRVVGIENGEAEPFRDQPPYYDRMAVDRGPSDHLIIAMFSTRPASGLPSATTRVTTVHVWIEGDTPPVYDVKLQAAAGPEGQAIPADVSLRELPQEGTTR
jgi:hypothetical protein